MKPNLKYIIPVIAAIVGLVVLCLILFTGINDVVDDKEINNWKWGKFAVAGSCPVKTFPIPIRPAPELEAGTEAQIVYWNHELSKPVFVMADKGVPVVPAPKSHKKYKEYCRPVILGDGSNALQRRPHTFAWTEFRGKPRSWRQVIYVCLEKYKNAVQLMSTPVAASIKKLGLSGIIRHELGHLLIGPGHPKYADLMSSGQQLIRLHAHTRALIEKTLIKPCSH